MGSCGAYDLSLINEGNYNQTKDVDECNPYIFDIAKSSFSAAGEFVCAFKRPFLYSGVSQMNVD